MVAVLVSSVIATIPFIAAGNALGLFKFGWQVFGDSFRRLPERKEVWGTVYDSASLRPLPFAVVSMRGTDKRILEKRITDVRGRYGFLTTPASLSQDQVRVSLDVSLEGFRFPSERDTETARLIYGAAYRGEAVAVRSDMLVNYDIPMDPVQGRVISRTNVPSVAIGVATAAMADAGLWIGIAAVPLAFALDPNPFTLGVLFIFAGVASLRLFGIAEHPYGTVADASGKAMPFALVSLHDDSGKRTAFAVSDERGRYVLAAERGGYVVSAHTPANIKPPREAERSISAHKGWITEQIVL